MPLDKLTALVVGGAADAADVVVVVVVAGDDHHLKCTDDRVSYHHQFKKMNYYFIPWTIYS